jgi:hypothetical protein
MRSLGGLTPAWPWLRLQKAPELIAIVNSGDKSAQTEKNVLKSGALPLRLGRSLGAGLALGDSSCLAFGGHTLDGGASPRGPGIDIGFSRRLLPIGGFFSLRLAYGSACG